MDEQQQLQAELDPALAYDLMAAEFYDDCHVTTRNFDQATVVATKLIADQVPSGLALELGAGRGRAGEYLQIPQERILQCDISRAMLTLEPRESSLLRLACDARSTPFVDSEFACVCAFLYDSFNTADLYIEVARLLRPGGLFIGTLPSFLWGTTLRSEIHMSQGKTRFRLRDGSSVVTASHLSPDRDILSMSTEAGLDADIKHLTLPFPHKDVSPDIERPATLLGVGVADLPVVQLIIARKPNTL